MWRALRPSWRRSRWFSSDARRLNQVEDEGDWFYSSEWWADPGSDSGHTVFKSHSETSDHWPATERWLQERYAKIHPEFENNGQFKILGYQWRVLHFNDDTRQSTVKVMAAYRKCDLDPGSLYLMQQPHVLPVPYVKSMLSVGMATLASFHYDLPGAVSGEKPLHILCIGHGGGSLPLFLASRIRGAVVHVVEIDHVVISASIQAMGFPASAVKETLTQPDSADQVMWEGIHERLFLFKTDAEKFILENTNVYDLVFVDAYDGDDIFPRQLWDPDSKFMKALGNRVHPDHGTVIVNLHADSDISTPGMTDYSHLQSILPMGKYVSQVSRAYKERLGQAFTVSVPYLCNISLVACRGGSGSPMSGGWESILRILKSRSNFIEYVLGLPFPCIQYIVKDFMLVD